MIRNWQQDIYGSKWLFTSHKFINVPFFQVMESHSHAADLYRNQTDFIPGHWVSD